MAEAVELCNYYKHPARLLTNKVSFQLVTLTAHSIYFQRISTSRGGSKFLQKKFFLAKRNGTNFRKTQPTPNFQQLLCFQQLFLIQLPKVPILAKQD